MIDDNEKAQFDECNIADLKEYLCKFYKKMCLEVVTKFVKFMIIFFLIINSEWLDFFF